MAICPYEDFVKFVQANSLSAIGELIYAKGAMKELWSGSSV